MVMMIAVVLESPFLLLNIQGQTHLQLVLGREDDSLYILNI
jgi:hypothetical protein